jgi:hypothetical protein
MFQCTPYGGLPFSTKAKSLQSAVKSENQMWLYNMQEEEMDLGWPRAWLDSHAPSNFEDDPKKI